MDCLYYTDGIISNKATLTKLCILFDHVRTFYLSPSYYLVPLERRWCHEKERPFFSKSPCERDLLSRIHSNDWEAFIKKNNKLIKYSILQPIIVNESPPDWESFEVNEKKLLEKGAGIGFGIWGQSIGLVPKDKIYVDSPWFSLYRWQSIAGALYFAIKTQHIPISDNYELSSLASETVTRFSDITHQPELHEVASHIAFRSMSLLVPDFPSLKADEILEVRGKLGEQLKYFRVEMLAIAKELEPNEYNDIDSIVVERIQPHLDDIKLKIKSLKGELFRKLARVFFVGGGAIPLLSSFLSLPISAQLGAIAGLAGKTLLDIHAYRSEHDQIISQSNNRGLIFLLDVEKKYRSRKA